MNRWQESFKSDQFHNHWESIKAICSELVENEKQGTAQFYELARLQKVRTYLDDVLGTCDSELMPLNVLSESTSSANQCLNHLNEFRRRPRIQHVSNANSSIDVILKNITPYVRDARSAARASTIAFREYSSVIESQSGKFHDESKRVLDSFDVDSKKILDDLQERYSSIEDGYNKIDPLNKELVKLFDKYFNEEETLEEEITNILNKLKSVYSDMEEYHELVLGEDVDDSLSRQLSSQLEYSQITAKNIKKLLDQSQQEIEELQEFYQSVFGSVELDGDEEVEVAGLKQEIKSKLKHLDDLRVSNDKAFKELKEAREKQLDDLEKGHSDKYDALNKQIEGLLPGATSAGLATAFNDLKRTFKWPLIGYNMFFYISVVLLGAGAIFSVVESYDLSTHSAVFVSIKDINELAGYFLVKLPLIAPAIWLILFTSKRRSEVQRLHQEYAHKEAVAKSYENFKRQIDLLTDADQKELLTEKLLAAAIDTVSKNASETLDKKHGDKMPAHEVIDKAADSVDKIVGSVSKLVKNK